MLLGHVHEWYGHRTGLLNLKLVREWYGHRTRV